jgi:hypothetical protein
MAFDIKQHYGQCIGGVLDGCVTQDGKFYTRDGVEVDSLRQPVKHAAPAKPAPAKPAAVKAPAIDPQVAEQLKGD